MSRETDDDLRTMLRQVLRNQYRIMRALEAISTPKKSGVDSFGGPDPERLMREGAAETKDRFPQVVP